MSLTEMPVCKRILLLCLVLWGSCVFAQQFSSEGKSFYVSFPQYISGTPTEDIVLASRTNTQATLENIHTGFSQIVNLTANTPVTITVPVGSCVPDTPEIISNRTIHVTSSDFISVYAVSTFAAIADAALILPEDVWGSNYYVASWSGLAIAKANSTLIIIAGENNSLITITPSVPTTTGRLAWVPFTITLNKGQVYRVSGNNTFDLTGTSITSAGQKKFAVIGGAGCVNIPNTTCPACDMLIEQMVPANQWGKTYMLAPFRSSSFDPKYTFRIIAQRNGTNVTINSSAVTMQKGQMVEYTNQSGNKYISSDEPILVVQYMQGQSCVSVGDPAMVVVPPVEQSITRVNFTTATHTSFTYHALIVIMKTVDVNTLYADGAQISSSLFQPFSYNIDYSFAYLQVSSGSHIVESSKGFILIAYGYGNFISYAFTGGCDFKVLNFDIGIRGLECGSRTFNFFNLGDTSKILSSYWDFGDGTTDSGKQVHKTYAVHGKYNIKNIVTYKGSTIATDSSFYELKTLQNPNADFTISDTLKCENRYSVFSSNTSTFLNGSHRTEIDWRFSDDSLKQYKNTDTISRFFKNAGTYWVRLIAQSDEGCKDSISKKVQVLPSVKPAFLYATPLCFAGHLFRPAAASSIASPYGITGYRWNFGDGSSDTVPVPKKTFADTGKYLVTLATLASNGCHDTITKPLNVIPSPIPAFTASHLCFKDSMQFENTSSIAKGILSYAWNYGDGTFATGKQNAKLFKDTGLYDISLKAMSDSGCVDSVIHRVAVKPKPDADFSVPNACAEDTLNFIDNTNRHGIGLQQNFWDFNDGNTKITNGNTRYFYTLKGIYKVKLLTIAANACADSIEKDVTIYPKPHPDFMVTDICLNDSAFFDNKTIDTGINITGWRWTFGDNYTSTEKSPWHSYNSTGFYTASLYAESDQGCKNLLTKNPALEVKRIPAAHFLSAFFDSYTPKTTYNFTNTSQGAINYLWTFGDGGMATDPNPQYTWNDTGHFKVQLTATNNLGCHHSFDTVLFVYPYFEIVIPNAFTPGNGDILNPVFRVEGIYYVRRFDFRIFDRWGQVVFNADHPSKGWDGTFKGTPVPDGVYVYSLVLTGLDNKVVSRGGNITLLR